MESTVAMATVAMSRPPAGPSQAAPQREAGGIGDAALRTAASLGTLVPPAIGLVGLGLGWSAIRWRAGLSCPPGDDGRMLRLSYGWAEPTSCTSPTGELGVEPIRRGLGWFEPWPASFVAALVGLVIVVGAVHLVARLWAPRRATPPPPPGALLRTATYLYVVLLGAGALMTFMLGLGTLTQAPLVGLAFLALGTSAGLSGYVLLRPRTAPPYPRAGLVALALVPGVPAGVALVGVVLAA